MAVVSWLLTLDLKDTEKELDCNSHRTLSFTKNHREVSFKCGYLEAVNPRSCFIISGIWPSDLHFDLGEMKCTRPPISVEKQRLRECVNSFTTRRTRRTRGPLLVLSNRHKENRLCRVSAARERALRGERKVCAAVLGRQAEQWPGRARGKAVPGLPRLQWCGRDFHSAQVLTHRWGASFPPPCSCCLGARSSLWYSVDTHRESKCSQWGVRAILQGTF